MAGRFIAPSEQYFDNSGNVLSGGKLYFYDSGTATAKDTYSDPDGTVPNTNPVVLNSAGRPDTDIFLVGSYKLVVTDANDVQIDEADPVLAADDTTKGFAVWNAVTVYSTDDIIRGSDNLLYISIANSNQNFEPSANATKWTQVQLLSSYNANETYSIGDVVIDSVGDIYRSLANSNTGNTPSSSPASWSNTVSGSFAGNVTVGGTLDVTGEASMSGAVTIDANVDTQLILTRSAGNNRILAFKSGTLNRWTLYADGTAESGATAGSNLQIGRYNDAGTFIENAVTVNRSTGSVAITGAISKGSGSFKIDHPLKPDTHHLVHSFTESPQADLLYSGSINLVGGKAEVDIDDHHGMTAGTFEALCREIRVFTTNESDWEPIKGYVKGSTLYISCKNESCTDTVSWLVIGERKDSHMFDTDWTDDTGRVIVEPEKVLPPEPTYVQRTLTIEVQGETEPKIITIEEHIEMIDGVATLIPEDTREVEVPKTKKVPVFNRDGSPAMVSV